MSPDPRSDDRAARILLSRLAGPAARQLHQLVSVSGAVDVVGRLVAGQLRDPVGALRARLNSDPGAIVDSDLAAAGAVGARAIMPGDAEWPTQLDDLAQDAPLLLWARGEEDLRLTALRSVAIVGARASTAYGTTVAVDLAEGLTQRGWTVVSGGAYGIDAAAHTGALAALGPTVAVLAGGIDVPYPRAHETMFTQIAEHGVLISESAPGQAPHRAGFLIRNRLIAALTRGTVVVEAAVRSGALATARDARDLLRIVMGVPGPVTSAMSVGVHRLLREQGLLVTSVDDIVDAIGPLGGGLGVARVDPRDIDPIAPRILAALPTRGGMAVDALAGLIGQSAPHVAAVLGLLELDGHVHRHRDGWRVTVGLRGAAR